MRHALVSSFVLLIGCFDPESDTPSEASSGGTEDTGTTAAPTSDASMSASGATTTMSTTVDPETSTGTTMATDTSSESGDPACGGGGQQCLEIPGGWDGPFLPELGQDGQCDDASFPVMYAGTTGMYDAACSCSCAGTTAQTCVMDVLLGGQPDACGDNDEIAATCTYALPSGTLDCNGDSFCVPTGGESAEMNSYRQCGAVDDDTVTPAFSGGYRLCDADDIVGTPCDGGQCVDSSAAACIARAGEGLECPPAFPNAIVGWQSFSETDVACGCECADQADCGYIGWWESNNTCPGGSDDDPSCSNGGVAVGMLQFLAMPGACQPVEAAPEDPPFPFAEPLTLCCTVEL